MLLGAQSQKYFKCKYDGCIYSEGSKRYFEKYQYLKQHYDKVHAEKIYSCSLCSKSFSTTTLLKSHLSGCGKEFKCSCGAAYKSNEALLTHAKRKLHFLGGIPRFSTVKSSEQAKRTSQFPDDPNIQNSTLVVLIDQNNHSQKNVWFHSTSKSKLLKFSEIKTAIALSELSCSRLQHAMELSKKKEASTQTEHSCYDELLNFVSNQVSDDSPSVKIHNSGTQTDDICKISSLKTTHQATQDPGSPWLGLCAETQTGDEDELRPFNLCDIQTQTPWSELDDDSTEFAHTETQTLLSTIFMEASSLGSLQNDNIKGVSKQNSNVSATYPTTHSKMQSTND